MMQKTLGEELLKMQALSGRCGNEYSWPVGFRSFVGHLRGTAGAEGFRCGAGCVCRAVCYYCHCDGNPPEICHRLHKLRRNSFTLAQSRPTSQLTALTLYPLTTSQTALTHRHTRTQPLLWWEKKKNMRQKVLK